MSCHCKCLSMSRPLPLTHLDLGSKLKTHNQLKAITKLVDGKTFRLLRIYINDSIMFIFKTCTYYLSTTKSIAIKSIPVLKRIVRELHDYRCSSHSGAPVNANYNHFLNLTLPKCKVLATYVWIDGTGRKLRSKDRVLDKEPSNLKTIPKWSFDGSSTGQAKTGDSEIILIPAAMYQDPFRTCPHIIILCETVGKDGTPTATNHRAECAKVLSSISDQDPWFGIEQEYTMFNAEFSPLGWPGPRGFPALENKFSYCGLGRHVAGREIVECHARASLFAGMDYGGSNAEVMKGSWEFQVGTTPGIKAADDLWMGRYLLERISESFGVAISYHPKPMGPDQPGIGCHHNFSVNKMRSDGGLKEIERVCKFLCENHKKYMKHYGSDDGEENRKRLTGKFETAAFDTCTWAVGDRSASIRLHRSVLVDNKGFLEDRRPAGDCDPYRICALLAQTCK